MNSTMTLLLIVGLFMLIANLYAKDKNIGKTIIWCTWAIVTVLLYR